MTKYFNVRKILVVLLIVSMLVFGACGDNGPEPPPQAETPVEQTTPEPVETPEPEHTPEPTPEPDVVVTFTDMTSIHRNSNQRIFRDRVEFRITVSNNTDQYIRGIQGRVDIQDMFGSSIWRIGCDLVGQTIPPGGTVEFNDLGIDVNQFIDNEVRVFTTAFEDLVFIYEVTQIVFAD